MIRNALSGPRFALLTLALAIGSHGAYAETYYVDPAAGDTNNPGTSSKPWRTLAEVFSSKKTFAPGDEILLRTGYHGEPRITGNNTTAVTIRPDGDAKPTVKSLRFQRATQWVVAGIDICPENAGAGTYDTGFHLQIDKDADHITVKDCSIRGALSVTGWTEADWNSRMGFAVVVQGSHCTLAHNALQNVGFGIRVYKTADHCLVSHNTITDFMSDAINALADDCTYEYNTVKNCYAINGNHDDCFQSWSLGEDGKVGRGVVKNVVVRGNTFIGQTDPQQPFPSLHLQAIGCFDGIYENWVIENNVVAIGTSTHGISLYGAINCKILNNTVVKSPAGSFPYGKPSIMILPHKPDASTTPPTPWSVPSKGNIIQNNFACAVTIAPDAGTADHNIASSDYAGVFADYDDFNFSPQPTSPLVAAGSSDNAPTIDINEKPRSKPCDIGAYQH